MANLAGAVDSAIRAAGVAIVGVAIGSPTDKATWRVAPINLQSAAQPTIDAFNPTDPALDVAELDKLVALAMDNERIFSAIVWAVVDTYSAPATRAKYLAARSKIVDAYKTRPWLP